MWMRRAFIAASTSSLACATLPALAWPQETSSTLDVISPQREADSYAVYSQLISTLERPRRGYLIAATTEVRQNAPRSNQKIRTPLELAQEGADITSRMQVPDDRLAQFEHAVEDYRQRKNQHIALARKFQLPHPYQLLSEEETKEYLSLSPGAVVATLIHPLASRSKAQGQVRGQRTALLSHSGLL